jgi:hypothetical protein
VCQRIVELSDGAFHDRERTQKIRVVRVVSQSFEVLLAGSLVIQLDAAQIAAHGQPPFRSVGCKLQCPLRCHARALD